MKIGLLAFSTPSGLGIQTKEFYDHMKPTKTLVVDIKALNQIKTNHYWYKKGDVRIANGLPNDDHMNWLAKDVDVVFLAENPLNYKLFEYAKCSVQQLNYEFCDYFDNPTLPAPTIIGMPSTWGIQQVEELKVAKVIRMPVPINRELIPFREIKKCKTFVHIVGRPAVHDRNGTWLFLKAAEKLGPRFKYKLYIQPPKDPLSVRMYKPLKERIDYMRYQVEIIKDVPNYQDIYKTGDVLVLPRRFGGLCLPMQEALSAGMPVIMPDITPNKDVLPPEWLVKTSGSTRQYIKTMVDVYEPSLDDLLDKMLQFRRDSFMRNSNIIADDIAEGLSWENMKPKYEEIFVNAINHSEGGKQA